MMEKDLDSAVISTVERYIDMRTRQPDMYQEAMWQYADMAHGGRAFDGNSAYIRDEYYPNRPNKFFLLVLSGLGEFERYLTHT